MVLCLVPVLLVLVPGGFGDMTNAIRSWIPFADGEFRVFLNFAIVISSRSTEFEDNILVPQNQRAAKRFSQNKSCL